MSYTIGCVLRQCYFLVKASKELAWGIIGTLTNGTDGDIAFKFVRQDIEIPFGVGDVLRVDGSITEYNGAPQVTGVCMRVEPTDAILRQVIPTSPIDIDAEFDFLVETAHSISDTILKSITLTLLYENEKALRKLPAGMIMHHACIGGWVEHTAGILKLALAVQGLYGDRVNRDLLIAGSVLHDVGKLQEFELNPVGLASGYTFLGDGVGHASIGVGMIMTTAARLHMDIMATSVTALLNIVGSHAGNREWGACADPLSIEAMIISHLDNIDAHVNSMSNSLKGVEYGESAFNKSLHMSIYRTSD